MHLIIDLIKHVQKVFAAHLSLTWAEQASSASDGQASSSFVKQAYLTLPAEAQIVPCFAADSYADKLTGAPLQ